jgi:Type IV secretion-system coupling protein DNA-binding domain
MNGRLKPRKPLRQRLIGGIRDYFGLEESPTWIRIPRADETEHIMLLGDPGTGKSQTIHHFLLQIAARQPAEAVVIYDPACEFIKRHYNHQREDVILNPTDQRSPYWSPSVELHTLTDKKLLAESFLPGKSDAHQAASSSFFLKAARAIFGRMLEFKPTPAQMVQWLKSEDAIDMIVAGTEHTHLIPKNAHGQRAGVLGVLAELGDILRLLPERDVCESEISLSEWASRRRGWIFITSKMDMREALRPLQAAFINILMKRLMSVSPEWGQAHPCWLIVDEVHSLHRLPALYETETEGRKYGIKLIQGTQGKTQYEEYYERLSKAMLAAPKLKLFFRCGEAESARWISDTIGEYEVEKPRIATTASVEDRGRDALNYSTTTEHRQAISKEEIMALPDLHGYWKYGDAVVPFRLPLAPVKIKARGYIARELTTSDVSLPVPMQVSDMNHPIAGDVKQKQTKPRRRPRPTRDTKRHKQAITPNHMQIEDGSALSIAHQAEGNDAQVENPEIEVSPQTREALRGCEEFEQEQNGVMNI